MNELKEKSWDEFKASGLLWFTNRLLHLFGWVIAVEYVDDDERVFRAFPARTCWRGFTPENDEAGFHALTEYMVDNAKTLQSEISLPKSDSED